MLPTFAYDFAGQLMTLGKFSSKVMPVVFSWPTGNIFSFFRVRRMLPTFAYDFAHFLQTLHAGGITEVHIISHSMGCDLVIEALPHIETLLSTAIAPAHGASDAAVSQ